VAASAGVTRRAPAALRGAAAGNRGAVPWPGRRVRCRARCRRRRPLCGTARVSPEGGTAAMALAAFEPRISKDGRPPIGALAPSSGPGRQPNDRLRQDWNRGRDPGVGPFYACRPRPPHAPMIGSGEDSVIRGGAGKRGCPQGGYVRARSRGTNGRWAAKLLFQWRVCRARRALKRRLCEERIIVFSSRSAKDALKHAERAGKHGLFKYRTAPGEEVFFEFIGVMDLLQLGVECGPEEAWYEIVERLHPMERRRQLIPPRATLLRGPRRTHGNQLVESLIPGGRRKRAE